MAGSPVSQSFAGLDVELDTAALVVSWERVIFLGPQSKSMVGGLRSTGDRLESRERLGEGYGPGEQLDGQGVVRQAFTGVQVELSELDELRFDRESQRLADELVGERLSTPRLEPLECDLTVIGDQSVCASRYRHGGGPVSLELEVDPLRKRARDVSYEGCGGLVGGDRVGESDHEPINDELDDMASALLDEVHNFVGELSAESDYLLVGLEVVERSALLRQESGEGYDQQLECLLPCIQ